MVKIIEKIGIRRVCMLSLIKVADVFKTAVAILILL